MNDPTDFNYHPDSAEFMNQVQRTLIEQDDYRGMGMHDVQDHGGHGPHSQVSIGLGDTTVNFRELQND